MTIIEKNSALQELLRGYGSVMVAFSGGVDSAFLAYAAHAVLGKKMLAVLADSPSLSRSHLNEAKEFAATHEIPLEIIATQEMKNQAYRQNDARRCYYCKDELFTRMEERRVVRDFARLAYGMNVDDQSDFRPGGAAAAERGVTAPLVDANLTKQEIRALAKMHRLEVWDKPASACLASRIEPGQPVTVDALRLVESGEAAMRSLGFRQCRVRLHGELARVEIDREELPRALEVGLFAKINEVLAAAGFRYVTLDMQGYRSGSMNGGSALVTLQPAQKVAH